MSHAQQVSRLFLCSIAKISFSNSPVFQATEMLHFISCFLVELYMKLKLTVLPVHLKIDGDGNTHLHPPGG